MYRLAIDKEIHNCLIAMEIEKYMYIVWTYLQRSPSHNGTPLADWLQALTWLPWRPGL